MALALKADHFCNGSYVTSIACPYGKRDFTKDDLRRAAQTPVNLIQLEGFCPDECRRTLAANKARFLHDQDQTEEEDGGGASAQRRASERRPGQSPPVSDTEFMNWRRFGGAAAFGWLERRDGKYLQSVRRNRGTKEMTKVLAGPAVEPQGLSTRPFKGVSHLQC